MRIHHWMLAGVAAVALAGTGQAASLYVFGDSLVDSGNADALLRGFGQPSESPPAGGYFQGRFSNGPNFADLLDPALTAGPATAYAPFGAVGLATYSYNTRNFAIGGAEAAEVPSSDPLTPLSFDEQISAFAASGQIVDPTAQVLVTFGGNDIQRQLITAAGIPGYTPTLTAAELALDAGLERLIGLGFTNILVTGQADVGVIPRITQFNNDGLEALGTGLSFQLNEAFRRTALFNRFETDTNVRFFDLFTLNQALLANPAAFGIANTTSSCQSAGPDVVAAGCDGYLFFDQIHPTTAVHGFIAAGIRQALVAPIPEPATWAMMAIGFGLVGGLARRRQAAAA